MDGMQENRTGAKVPVSVPKTVGSLAGVQVTNPTGTL